MGPLGQARGLHRFWWGNLKKRHIGRTGVDERIIIGWILRKRNVGM